MNNIKELKYAIETNNYSTKGAFNYKSHDVKKDGDISAEYKKIEIHNDIIKIYECETIADNVKIYGTNHVGYTCKETKILEKEMTFDELKNSEYWENIFKRYKFNKEEYFRYEKDEIYIDDHYIETSIYKGAYNLNIRFDRYDGILDISSIQNKEANYNGKIFELVTIDNKQNYENIMNKKLIDLMKNHRVEILNNGFVIDNTYYEDIEDFKEGNSDKNE